MKTALNLDKIYNLWYNIYNRENEKRIIAEKGGNNTVKLEELGITPQKEKQFQKKGITSVEELLTFLPIRYNDFTTLTGILSEEQVSVFTAVVVKVGRSFSGKQPVYAHCKVNGRTKLTVMWFNQAYIYNEINTYTGKTVLISGKVKRAEDGYMLFAPLIFEDAAKARKIVPVYSKIRGMSEDYLTDKIEKALIYRSHLKDPVPAELLQKRGLPTMQDAVMTLHQPDNGDELKAAKERMLYNSLLEYAAKNEWSIRNESVGSPFRIKTKNIMNKIRESLPYKLTSDQAGTVRSILDKMERGQRVNALVQGDVGCGKSITAFLLMAGFAESGYQAAIMAPTQILAEQHYNALTELVSAYGIKTVYIKAGMKAKEKREVYEEIKNGEADLIVGTSSLLSENVQYANLALVVTDEEHKFGVIQRSMLAQKASEGVHCISMSATPIPRTLAQTIYGDALQIYEIKTLPSGRKPVKTGISKGRDRIYSFIAKQVAQGRQAYVVCPMIDDNDAVSNVLSVSTVSKEFETALSSKGIRIGALTGRDSKEKAHDTIEAYKNGDIDVLVSTTVVEVGVNVPNASVIVIINAERFGLSQLHQLRGRVGRGEYEGYCVLETPHTDDNVMRRLNALCKTNDGFEIAIADLELRGAGELFGIRQSGVDIMLEQIHDNPEMYKKAQEDACVLFDKYYNCELSAQIRENFSSK